MTYNLVDHSRIECNGDGRWPCPAFFEARYGTEWAHEARQEAATKGWTSGPSNRRDRRRLDFCPDHRAEGSA